MTRRGEDSSYLSGQVGVVVHKRGSPIDRSDVEPSGHPAEGTESAGRDIGIDPDLHRKGERPSRVHRVVDSSERQAHLRTTTRVLHGEVLSTFGGDHVDDSIARLGVEPVRDAVGAASERRGDRVIEADHARPLHPVEVIREALDEGGEGTEVIEMIAVDVGEDGADEGQMTVRAIALIGLDDKPVRAGPLGTGANISHIAADDESGPTARRGEHEHEHRRGGRLAVGASDGERSRPRADRSEDAGPRGHGDTPPARLIQLVEIDRDGRRRGDDITAVHVAAVMTDVHADPRRPEPLEHLTLPDVATRHVVAHAGKGDRDRAHPWPADADDVDATRLSEVGDHRRQALLDHFGHVRCRHPPQRRSVRRAAPTD